MLIYSMIHRSLLRLQSWGQATNLYGFPVVHWLWSVSVTASFVVLMLAGFGRFTAMELVLFYLLSLFILMLGYRYAGLRIFVWCLLVASAILFYKQVGTYPVVISVQRLMAGLVIVAGGLWYFRRDYMQLAGRLFLFALWLAMILFILRWQLGWQAGEATGQIPLTSRSDVILLVFTGVLLIPIVFFRQWAHRGALFLPAILMGLYILYEPLSHAGLPPLANPLLSHFWLNIHVPGMVVALSCFLLAGTMASLWYFHGVRSRGDETILGTGGQFYHAAMQNLLRAGILGLGIGLFSGMAWSDLNWGHYLLWEPKQIGSLALWFYYIAALHAGLQKRAGGLHQVYWLMAGVPLLLFVTIGINVWFDGRHFFS